MVAARIQGPFVKAGRSHERARIAASSHGGLAMLAIVYSPLLRGLAERKGIGYQTLLRRLFHEGLSREARRS